MPQDWIAAMALEDLGDGEVAGVELADGEGRGRKLALYNVEGRIYATDNLCTHGHAQLSDGWLDDCSIECPLHAGRFDIRTGKAEGPPVEVDLQTFETRIENGIIEVKLG